MENELIYLDHNATTPLHPEVENELVRYFSLFGNPSSMHTFGRKSREKIENVREIVASLINADTDEIIFVGSGSEANNTVLNLLQCRGTLCRGISFSRSGLITSSIEHPCVMDTSRCLSQHSIQTHFLEVDEYGIVDTDVLASRLSDTTGLVSIMYANNEIGTIQDIKRITRIVHEHGALMHTDAVQAVGKVPIDVKDLGVDFLSFSGHKFYGPKGVGVLYIKRGTPYCPFIHGGHQETGRRAGTENSLGIIGLGKAVEMAKLEMEEIEKRLFGLKEKLKAGILDKIPDVKINGHPEKCLPQTLNVSFFGAEGEAILLYLDMEGIAVSTGSACASGSLDPSHVLLATGLGPELAHGSIRFSLGRGNTEKEIDYVLDKLPHIIAKIRDMSTVYKGGK
ncbi:MAG: aminotransferase class V-fold PLP-dependent enzyme [Spirochaetales bacterium]|nr:aminotransferase class V-fold PLP-dependent enzyme [Spirochaetales bacterium]